MFYGNAKVVDGRSFPRDAALASLASLVFHCIVATACYFSFAQASPFVELPQVLTVSLISSFGPKEGVKPSSFPMTGEMTPFRERAEYNKIADIPVIVTEAGKEAVETNETPSVTEQMDAPGTAVQQGKDNDFTGLSITYAASQPAGKKTKPDLASLSGGSYSNPSTKGTAFGGREYSTDSGKGLASGGRVPSSGHAKAEPQAGSALTLAAPRYRGNSLPTYPLLARRRGYAGVVMLSVEVLADGSVGRLEMKKTSGYDLLDRSALEAVKGWKFSPGKKMGTPVNMWVDVPVRFELN